MKICKDSLLLVKLIGLPGLVEGEVPSLKEALSLFRLAELNKIPLLFLESLGSIKECQVLEVRLSHYRSRREKVLSLITLVSRVLEELGIPYAVFKTLRPFPYTPADVDVLLWSTTDLVEASQMLEKMGLKPLDRDYYGLTMFSVDYGVNVDLTTEVAVSGLIYLNKNVLFNHVHHVEVGGFKIRTLKPYADLVTVAAHSIYKEQMYTLSDYYTLVLSSQYFPEALKLAEALHVRFALEVALKLTYDITADTFGINNVLVKKLREFLQKTDVNEIIRVNKCLDLPLKYPPTILLRGLLMKLLEDPVSRKSLPTVLKSALQPKFINKLLNHITRKGY